MIRAIRSQADAPEAFEAASAATRKVNDKPDRARQEFKQDANVNWLVKKYGANAFMAPFQGGAFDFDADALSVRLQAQTLQESFRALPEAIRAKYGHWQGVLEAIERGELTTLEVQKAEAPAEVSSAGDPA